VIDRTGPRGDTLLKVIDSNALSHQAKATLVGLTLGTACASSLVFLPPEASAKWVRVNFRSTMVAGQELHFSNGAQITQPFYPSFILRDYSSSTMTGSTASWTQATNTWNYFPLFDFGTLTNTEAFAGSSYNARNTIGSAPDMLRFTNKTAANPTFTLNTGRANNATGYSVYPASDGVSKSLSNINLSGTIAGFNANQSNTSIGTFVQTALGGNTSQTFNCQINCTGQITTNEDLLDLTWDQITFELIEPVPSPLPVAGGAAAFAWARKLRRRSQAARSLELS
jgi:hypothetical protein